MSITQLKNHWHVSIRSCLAILMILCLKSNLAWAEESAIVNLEFSTLTGNQVQVQLEMNGPVTEPKIFLTDNPARIALDFVEVKSNLAKKTFPINQGAAGTAYVVEASGRTRVIINLVEKVPYETRIEGNKFYVLLKSVGTHMLVNKLEQERSVKDSAISKFLPEQSVKSLDFRRGPNGEGRLLVGLSAANTVVDAKQSGGKAFVRILNSHLPESLAKNLDVSDFATPVQKINVSSQGENVNITVTPNNDNYEFSTYQSDNLLTVEFRPLTSAEKEELKKEKFPYTGEKLSLNFQDIEIRSVLQILADFTELNIIAADSVAGNVTLRLNDVPWDQALELILKSKGLDKRQNGNVVMVAPVAEIMKIEQEALDSRKITEQLEPLKTESIQINYAKASEICGVLIGIGNNNLGGQSGGAGGAALSGGGSSGGGGGCGGSAGGQSGSQVGGSGAAGGSGGTNVAAGSLRLLSPRGVAIIDARTNTIIIKDTSKAMEEVRKMIKLLDVPIRQVMIETRIVVANTDFSRQLGVNLGVGSQSSINDATSGTIGSSLTGLVAAGSGNASTVVMTLASKAQNLLDLEIQALQTTDQGEQISNPRVMTTDRVKATILQGVQIPYTTQTANVINTNFKDAVLELDVTPQITPGGSVIMDLVINADSQGATITTGGQQNVAINKRGLTAKVQVEDGETVVLGGVYQTVFDDSYTSVPWFGDLPGIGWLFKSNQKTDTKKELLIFVTPKIVKNSLKIR